MSTKQVNGVKPHSQTLNHLTSYPLVSDVLKVYQQNSIGAKSIELYTNLYKTFAEPVLPYFQTPYSIVAPYVEKADELGNSTLEWTDSRFPVVKETNLGNLKEKVTDGILLPLTIAGQTKDYVFSTYADESKKVGGTGVVATGKSILSTELRIALESYQKLIEFLGPRGKEFDDKAREFLTNGHAKANELKENAYKTADKYTKAGQQKAGHVKQQAQQAVN